MSFHWVRSFAYFTTLKTKYSSNLTDFVQLKCVLKNCFAAERLPRCPLKTMVDNYYNQQMSNIIQDKMLREWVNLFFLPPVWVLCLWVPEIATRSEALSLPWEAERAVILKL